MLAVDSVDQLLLLDRWWRTDLLPALPATVTTVLAGRAGPSTAWWTAPAWRGLARGVPLGPLPDDAALALLAAAGVPGPAAERIRRLGLRGVQADPEADRPVAAARLRPQLRRTYTTVENPQRWLPLLAPLGFRPLREIAVPGETLVLAVLEFGEGSVDGWLARLVEMG